MFACHYTISSKWNMGIFIDSTNAMSWTNQHKTDRKQINHAITYNLAASWQNQQNDCAPSENSDQPGYPPSLIRVFVVRMKKAGVLSYPLSAQRRLWSDWSDAQADLSLRWAHSHLFCHEAAHLHSTSKVAVKCLSTLPLSTGHHICAALIFSQFHL